MNVLVITATRHAARQAGAGPATMRHRSTPEVRFWSPELNREGLRGFRFDMIVVDPDAVLPPDVRDWIRAHCTYHTTLLISGTPALELVPG